MAGEAVWLSTVTVHRAALQRVFDDWLFSGQIQARHCPPTAQERRSRQGSAQELQAGIQSTILVQIAGEGDTKAAATFLSAHSMMPMHQSAYRRYRSTETVLLKVFNDLQLAKNRGQVSALCLLDLTAAFDTVDHELLLRRLQRTFGIGGSTLTWFESYLSGRTYCVVVDSATSQVIHVLCSVFRGSVLGPLLFLLYTV